MLRLPLIAALLLAATSCTTTSSIPSILDQQTAAWNAGDIPKFMETYVRSEKLRFASGGSVRRGYAETLARYQKSYPTPEAMGTLTFEDLEVTQLSSKWAEVHGRYRLVRGGKYTDATGLFTLLLTRTPNGWKILHDHSSAAKD